MATTRKFKLKNPINKYDQAGNKTGQQTHWKFTNDSFSTGLGDVGFGNVKMGEWDPASTDELIKARTPKALRMLREGNKEARRLAKIAAQEQRDALEPYAGTEALDEQNAILGLSGLAAQQSAIENLPISEAQQEANRRQSATQQRQALASGDISGASLLGQQQIGAQQQSAAIQGRLAELEPLVATARSVRSALSGIDEAEASRLGQIWSGQGTQMSNLRMGSTAPLIESIQNRAELSGLQGIASANQRANTANQLGGLVNMGLQSNAFQSWWDPQSSATSALGAGFDVVNMFNS